jgi:adenine modification enzyme
MKGYIYSNQLSMFGSRDIIGFGTDQFYVQEIQKDLANKVIRENHYSHKVYSNTYICLGVFIAGKMEGVLQYGYAMNPQSCGSVVKDTEIDQYLELNRMWIADGTVKYVESQAISASVKYIRGRYPRVKWIQSFADERCTMLGLVYQACSFDYYGEHESIFWELDGVVYHNIQMTDPKRKNSGSGKLLQENKERAVIMRLRQFRYIKFLDQRWRSRCLLTQKAYPKYYTVNDSVSKKNNLNLSNR